MQENKKALYVGLATASVLIGGYVLYRMMAANSSIAEQLQKADLTVVKKDAKGGIDQTYFLSVLQFVGQATKAKTTSLRKECQAERRKHYNSEDWKAYEAVVKKTIEGEDIAAQAVVSEVIKVIGMTLEEFTESHQSMASNPSTSEFVMAAQQGKLNQNESTPKLSKEKTLTVFEKQQEFALDHMKTLSTRKT